jgi:hypothetical protein
MKRLGVWVLAGMAGISAVAGAQESARPKFDAFEVATVRPVDADLHAGRMFKLDGPHRWTATNFTLKNLIALAFDLNPRTISGGPGWMESQYFNIEAVVPGMCDRSAPNRCRCCGHCWWSGLR